MQWRLTKERARANTPNDTGKPLSESTPYEMAIHLNALVKAASHLVDQCPPQANVAGTGLPGLLRVIEERTHALQTELDAGVFSEGWEALKHAIDDDPTLGLNGYPGRIERDGREG